MDTLLLPPSEKNISIAVEALKIGQVVGVPTETVYGLAGNAFDVQAVTEIYAAKERPSFDPLIVHVAEGDLDLLEEQGIIQLGSISSKAKLNLQKLIAEFWPGPLTIVMPKGKRIPDLVTSGLPSVAVRMPLHPVMQTLLIQSGLPLAAPSANRFARISPTLAKDVIDELGGRIPFVIDGGKCSIGVESTVVAVQEDGEFLLLRPGGTPREAIEVILDAPLSNVVPSDQKSSPGMEENHYSPTTKMVMLPKPFSEMTSDELELFTFGEYSVGLLLFSGVPNAAWEGYASIRVLSSSGSDREAAQNLFQELRGLDRSGVRLILAEPCPRQSGLGLAIQDRLTRAAHKFQ